MKPIQTLSLWVAVCSAVVFSISCSKPGSKTSEPAAAGLSPDTVVAKYSGKTLTLRELDEKIAGQLEELEKQKHELRKQALDSTVIQSLVKAEAEKEKITEEQWLKREIEGKVTPPSDEELKSFFAANSAQLPPDAKFEDYRDRIVDHLSRPKKQELAKALFDQLKAKANVTLSLPEPVRPRKEVAADGPSKGPENAPVTIVEFSDFQCPYCSRASNVVEEVVKAYPGKVRLVFRQFPLEFHKEAPKAAEGALCANEQGKFWEYHDTLFKNQQALSIADLKNHANVVGLDAEKFTACLDSGKHAADVTKDLEAGKKVGVNGTPAFFINGIMLSGALPLDEFKKIIDEELKAK